MERNRRPCSGQRRKMPDHGGCLYQQLLGQQQAYNQTDQRDLVALRRFLAQHDALPAPDRRTPAAKTACSSPPACIPKMPSICAP